MKIYQLNLESNFRHRSAFGRVVSGMDVVEQIAAVQTGNVGGHADVPVEDLVIQSLEVIASD